MGKIHSTDFVSVSRDVFSVWTSFFVTKRWSNNILWYPLAKIVCLDFGDVTWKSLNLPSLSSIQINHHIVYVTVFLLQFSKTSAERGENCKMQINFVVKLREILINFESFLSNIEMFKSEKQFLKTEFPMINCILWKAFRLIKI